MPRQRILIITRNLPPLVGGMERLNWHMASELSKYAEVRVIGPKGSRALSPDNITLSECPLTPLPLFLFMASIRSLWTAFRWKPDIILAGSGLTAPLAWAISKICGARSAAYLHGFDISVKHRMYRVIWRPTFKKLDHVIVNSSPTRTLAIDAGVDLARLSIVYPGVELPNEPRPDHEIAAFREANGISGKKVLLSVGRLTTRKGLREFVKLTLPDIIKAVPDTVLVVIGDAPKNSLGASIQSIQSILDEAEKLGIVGHVKFLGVITDKIRLANAYQSADLHVFPVRHIPDDPEGFGMVAIEAASHGLPTVAFATGGVIDAVKHGHSGYLVGSNDYQQLSSKIIEILEHPLCGSGVSAFANDFEWSHFGRGVWNALLESKRSAGKGN